jgi:hypothetical protein
MHVGGREVVHVMSRGARDVKRGAAVYGMSRVRGSDARGEQRGEVSSAFDEQRGKNVQRGGSSNVCE